MSKQIKKTQSSVSFSLSRWFRKLSTNAPSKFLVTLIGIGYTIFLFGGGLFTLITRPLPSYYTQSGQFLFLYPDISGQFVSDTLIAVILFSLGFAGLFAIYQSSKSAYKPRQAYMLLVIGVAFLLISYIFLEGSIAFKISGGR